MIEIDFSTLQIDGSAKVCLPDSLSDHLCEGEAQGFHGHVGVMRSTFLGGIIDVKFWRRDNVIPEANQGMCLGLDGLFC